MFMSFAEKKINKAIDSLKSALKNIESGNERLAIGDLDFSKSYSQEAIWLLVTQMEIDEEMRIQKEVEIDCDEQ